MMLVILLLSFLFFILGFILNESNAKYLLSGYNTMSVEEQSNFNLKSYLNFFKKFHIFLGISFLIGGCVLKYLVSENATGIFLGIYPIVAYLFLIIRSNKYSIGQYKKTNRIGIVILLFTLFGVIFLLFLGFQEDRLLIDGDQIVIEGFYGERLQFKDIDTVLLFNTKPEIAFKSNGFALGEIKKGYFKTKSGEEIKLILNSSQSPMILIVKKSGQKIIYSTKNESNINLMGSISHFFKN